MPFSTPTNFSNLLFIGSLCLMAISFNTNAQSLTGITPNSANRGSSLSVTITGQNTNFAAASSTSIRLQQGSATITGSYNPSSTNTSLNASFNISSFANLGLYDVFVSNSLDGSMTLNNAFNINPFPVPKILSITPDTAVLGQTLSVTITSQNTNFNQSSSSVNVVLYGQSSSTSITATSTNVINPTSVSAQFSIPAPFTIGDYDVQVGSVYESQLFYINGGTSSINGTITQGAKASAGGDPIKDLKLWLLSAKDDTLLSYTTNNDGEFEFNFLAYGTYKLIGEKLNNQDPIIFVLNAQNPDIDIELVLNGDQLAVVGIQDQKHPIESLNLFPNPFTDHLNIQLELSEPNEVSITLYDITGKEVDQIISSQLMSKSNTIELDMKMYDAQMYFLKIEIAGKAAQYHKLLKTNLK